MCILQRSSWQPLHIDAGNVTKAQGELVFELDGYCKILHCKKCWRQPGHFWPGSLYEKTYKIFFFCALNNHKIEILSFFSIPRKSLWYNIERYHCYAEISL